MKARFCAGDRLAGVFRAKFSIRRSGRGSHFRQPRWRQEFLFHPACERPQDFPSPQTRSYRVPLPSDRRLTVIGASGHGFDVVDDLAVLAFAARGGTESRHPLNGNHLDQLRTDGNVMRPPQCGCAQRARKGYREFRTVASRPSPLSSASRNRALAIKSGETDKVEWLWLFASIRITRR